MKISKRCRRTMYRAPQVFRTAFLVSVFVYGESVLLAQNADEIVASLEQQSAAQLETRLTEISDRLDRLSQYKLRSGVGAIGYRSKVHDNGNHHEWIRIDLGEKTLIDQVVIVPTLLRNAEAGFRAEGFPLQFRVVVGTGAKQDGTVVASFDAEDQLLPRIALVVIPFNETTASWVVVEAELLTARQFDGRYLLQFAEILVFSGYENVAQRRPLQTSSNEPTGSPAWGMHFVVDGFMPYLMNGAGEKKASLSSVNIERIINHVSRLTRNQHSQFHRSISI